MFFNIICKFFSESSTSKRKAWFSITNGISPSGYNEENRLDSFLFAIFMIEPYEHAHHETTDMRKPGNRCLHPKRKISVCPLQQKPDQHEDNGRDFDYLDDEEDRDDGDNLRSWIENEVRTHNRCNCTRSPDDNQHGMWMNNCMRIKCKEDGNGIKHDKTDPPEFPFYRRPEYPEEEHVPEEVNVSSVQKTGNEYGAVEQEDTSRSLHEVYEDIARAHPIELDDLLAHADFLNEHGHVDYDDKEGEGRKPLT